MSVSLTNLGEDLTGLATNSLGPLLAGVLAGTGPYRTKPVNTLPPALYSLAIRTGSPPYLPLFIYLFPISPSNLQKQRAGMGNFYDVAGSPALAGVQRTPDLYGLSPPIWTISGTTGVKTHSTDHYLFTGLQSALILQGVIEQYFSLVAAAGGTNLPRLEFYDYYASDFWQVVPLQPQTILQSASAPQLLQYQFRLVGIQSLLQPLTAAIDTLLSPLVASVGQGISSLGSSINSALGNYSPFGPAASS